MSRQVQVQPATIDQQAVLANLLELYAHDFSEFYDVELGEDGRFGYPSLPLYWSEPGRHPFLIRVHGKLAGFALIKRGQGVLNNEDVWDMAEFFIVRGRRRQSVGVTAAHELWSRFPGVWEVRVMEANRSAVPFWERAVSSFIRGSVQPTRIQKAGKQWHVFRFNASASCRA